MHHKLHKNDYFAIITPKNNPLTPLSQPKNTPVSLRDAEDAIHDRDGYNCDGYSLKVDISSIQQQNKLHKTPLIHSMLITRYINVIYSFIN